MDEVHFHGAINQPMTINNCTVHVHGMANVIYANDCDLHAHGMVAKYYQASKNVGVRTETKVVEKVVERKVFVDDKGKVTALKQKIDMLKEEARSYWGKVLMRDEEIKELKSMINELTGGYSTLDELKHKIEVLEYGNETKAKRIKELEAELNKRPVQNSSEYEPTKTDLMRISEHLDFFLGDDMPDDGYRMPWIGTKKGINGWYKKCNIEQN